MNLNPGPAGSEGWREPIQASWFDRPATEVAPDLLGKLLVRQVDGACAAGRIVETEAYQGEDDQGCHAKAGLTERTRVMYGNPGTAYIYFTYGMHWLLNVVCMPVGFPAAVLIRAIQPIFGEEFMQARRPAAAKGWLNGPAKLCQALAVDGQLNGANLCQTSSGLWIADDSVAANQSAVRTTPRIGLNTVPEPWRSLPWRYTLE
jgi:DNA-3-methyladenine glycosylase